MQRTRAQRRTVVLAAALGLVLAACGDAEPDPSAVDDTETVDPDEREEADEPVPDEEAAPEEDEAEAADEEAPDEAPEADEEELGVDELAGLVADAAEASAQVTYEIEATGVSGTVTLVQDPPRHAIAMEQEGVAFRTITDEDGTVICSEQAGEWQCFTQQMGEDMVDDGVLDLPGVTAPDEFEDQFEDQVDEQQPDQITRTTDLLDRDAVCVSFEEFDGEIADARFCFDEATGMLLLGEGTDMTGEGFRMEAIEVGDPDPSLLEPPAEPAELDFGG